jgi:hypothetical protein
MLLITSPIAVKIVTGLLFTRHSVWPCKIFHSKCVDYLRHSQSSVRYLINDELKDYRYNY